MSVREAINSKKSVGVGISVLFLIVAAIILFFSLQPAHRIKGDKTFFTDDDGQNLVHGFRLPDPSIRSQWKDGRQGHDLQL